MSKLVSHLELPPLFEKADRAMKEAVAAAIAEHWRAGRPVLIWQDEQVVALYPDGTCVPASEEGSVSPDGAPSKDR
ncbi:MAG TPA: hypothetical protein VIA62_03975 [Thermoanaerobaculia bacterium]|jgi:hypothetical protein|nr:hypothetical protein [Thermoanaerobaculia bacterium]